MNRTARLNPISEKRRVALAAAGITYPSSTFAKPDSPTMKAKPSKAAKRPADTGPDQATVQAVLDRDGYECVRCGGGVWGERGVHWSVQHRRARGNGGTNRPDANAPQTLILLCGTATTGCHGFVEAHPDEAKKHGWAIDNADDPLMKPVQHSLHGWVFLTADGGWTSRHPNHSNDKSEES